jgi:hypothetical protein
MYLLALTTLFQFLPAFQQLNTARFEWRYFDTTFSSLT